MESESGIFVAGPDIFAKNSVATSARAHMTGTILEPGEINPIIGRLEFKISKG